MIKNYKNFSIESINQKFRNAIFYKTFIYHRKKILSKYSKKIFLTQKYFFYSVECLFPSLSKSPLFFTSGDGVAVNSLFSSLNLMSTRISLIELFDSNRWLIQAAAHRRSVLPKTANPRTVSSCCWCIFFSLTVKTPCSQGLRQFSKSSSS